MCDSEAADDMAGTGRATAAKSRGNRERPAARLAAEPASTQPFNLLTALMQLLPQ